MPKGKILMGKKSPAKKKSYGAIVEKNEYAKRGKAAQGYVRGINKIVDAGPRGGLRAFADGRPVSERKVGGTFIPMTKAGAIAARKTKVLRGTQKKAK